MNDAAALVAADRVLVIAHRGDSRRAPENTLPAFVSALATPADFVELDYVHSSDGVPVVFHDDDLDRTTNAPAVLGAGLRPENCTLADLRRLDAGSWFRADFAGTRLPTLEEALAAILSGACCMVERKLGDAATCVELLQRCGALDRVIVQAFDWSFLADCRRLAPRLVLGALGHQRPTEERLASAAQLGVQVITWDQREVTAADIAAIHRLGAKAWVYTVNDRRRAFELLDGGIDGIISDVPGEMAVWVETWRRSAVNPGNP